MAKQMKTPPDFRISEHRRRFFDIGLQLELRSHDLPDFAVPRPGDENWLPIDDFLSMLADRTREPRMRPRSENSRATEILWKLMGPHKLMRRHLAETFKAVASADPEFRQVGKDDAASFMRDSADLKRAILDFVDAQKTIGKRLWFPTFDEGQSPEERGRRFLITKDLEAALLDAAGRLNEMEGWAWSRYDQLSPEVGGRPRIEWRHEFVACVAHSWTLLTGRPAPAGPNTLFAEFVEAAWASGSEDLGEVSWEATIRNVANKLNSDKTTLDAGQV